MFQVIMPSTTSAHTRVGVSRLHAQLSAHSQLLQNAALSTVGLSVCREWSLDTREWCRAPTVMEMYLPHPPHSHFLPGGSSRVNSSVKPFLPLWPALTTLPFEFLWHYYFQLSLSLLIRNCFGIVFDHFHLNFPSSLGTRPVS